MASTGFSEGSKVVVEQLDDVNWKVWEPFGYTGAHLDTFEVYKGMETDFASVPRAFVWFLPRYGAYTKAAMLHDLLWREYAAAGRMDYIDADGIFRRAMRELGVPFLRRWIMWGAVRWGALVKPGGRKGWLREAWRVLLVTLLALPIVVPPAILVVLALGAFFVVEGIAWVPLRLIAWAQERRGTPAKKVVKPAFEWKAT
ncbi:MAG: hypothetical protein QOI47_2332 [Actinomycetota bacterium]|jgi:hypothetical protein|nr:hypothetical protein [Actinomycetota bacterium]